MDNVITPWQFMLVALAGWVNRDQQTVIEYLKEENQILKEQLTYKQPGSDHAKSLTR